MDVCSAADGPVKTLLSVSVELPICEEELSRDIAFHLTQSGRLSRHKKASLGKLEIALKIHR